MSTRSTRKQPFCWQAKHILRQLKSKYTGNELSKYRNLYLTLTQMDSDFNGDEINHYTKTIATYSGLPRDWIPKALEEFSGIGLITMIEIRDDKKRIVGRTLTINDSDILDNEEPNNLKPVIRNAGDRNPTHKKILFSKEDSIINEDKEKSFTSANEEQSSEQKSSSISNSQIQPIEPENIPCDDQGMPIEEERKKSSDKRKKPNMPVVKTEEARNVNEVISIFNHNRLGDWIYKDQKERGAVKYLMKRMELGKLKRACEYALTVQGEDYAPTITRPSELKYKLTKLMAYWKNNNSNNKGAVRI